MSGSAERKKKNASGLESRLFYEAAVRDWKWDIPEHFNIAADCVDRNAEMSGRKDKVCLFWENHAGLRRQFTFLEMKGLTDRFGSALRAIGMTKGDRMLIQLPNIPEFHICFLGAMKIGTLPVPCSVMLKGKELEYLLKDSGAAAVITTSKLAGRVKGLQGECSGLKHIIETDAEAENIVSFKNLMAEADSFLEIEKTESGDPAFICYTSGTTGRPKGVVHAHRWLIGNDPGVLFWQDVRESDIVAHTSQLNWIFAFSNGFIFPWRQGASTIIYDGPFEARKWFELFEKYKVTNLVSVPTAYRILLSDKSAPEGRNLAALRHCISAGEPLTPEIYHEWMRRFGHSIYDGIGMTEHTVYMSNIRGMKVTPLSCGKPHPGHQCALLDSGGVEVEPGNPGILSTRKGDPSLFLGYWNRPELTEKSYSGEWHLSGDILYRGLDGYYYFSGRNDDLITCSGYRISPFEVESAVNNHPAVHESAAVAVRDESRGTIVKVFAVLNESHSPSAELAEEIRRFVKEDIASYKCPREIAFVKELPKTASGKIIRKQLREI